MITPISQFTKGILHIEGIAESANDRPDFAMNDHLESYISIYEEEYLKKMLGCEIGVEFIKYIKNRPGDKKQIIDKWENIITSLNEFEVSPIACYVFYWYVRINQTQATITGTTKNNTDNPVVSPNGRIIPAWNMMVTCNKYFIDWMDKNKLDYQGWDFDPDMLETINEFGI